MAKTSTALPAEMRDAIVWLERQPGVTSVVKGRKTRSVHHKNPSGFTRVTTVQDHAVSARVYGPGVVLPVTVHAKPGQDRDRWVATIAAGATVGGKAEIDMRPRVVRKTAVPVGGGTAVTAKVVQPEPTVRDAAHLYDVNPELAITWLEQNKRNRDLRDSTVQKYAADMKSGRWKVVGDAIQFDTSGSIINGQHRLWAVVESGQTVKLLVMFNCDPEAINVMDDHLKRSLKDVAKIRKPGAVIGSTHTAIANMLIQTSIAATLVDRRAALSRVSRQAQLETLDRHMDAIMFTVHECIKTRRVRSLTVTSVLTVLTRAYYTQQHDDLRHFGKVLLNGITEQERDRAVILLRNMLLQSAAAGTRPTADTIYRKTERALQAFVTGQVIGNLYEASEELFPLPEEQLLPRKK